MLSRQPILRAAQRASIRSPVARNFVQRRLNSSAPHDNEFLRERAAVKAHAASTSDLWRKLSIYAVIPTLILGSINAYNLWTEHWEHWSHMPALEDRVEYPYQNIRSKNYFWGDGDKTLFWNSDVNYHNKDKTT
ncbi:Cox13p [Nannizzia gypsea CBS 118893]|uniref:Cytochrome c oxidase subunit n=1 Tax=Arthroderma gypseum (strain ATCC MYA-4604 / CBS 118893) TaxID=535722 RepID=E4UWD1_ARTGP|nr:Cox13p [Nannizzia gypsea CBS 118893]EFR02526.1 Cox13p [Nannizzia gypsea CBS 118893]